MTTGTPDLTQTLGVLRTLITAPDGPAAALARHPEWTLPVKPSRTLAPLARVEIYAHMYTARILAALRDDFPALAAACGDARFDALVRAYVFAHPPTHFSLRYAGQHLSAYLRASATADAPWLADLAALEWNLIECFDALDTAPLTADDLRALAPEQWPALGLQTIPALRCMESAWNISTCFEAQRAGAPVTAPAADQTRIVIWRPQHDVRYRVVGADEYLLLLQLADPTSFEALCDHALRMYDESAAVPHLLRHLQQWAGDGLLLIN